MTQISLKAELKSDSPELKITFFVFITYFITIFIYLVSNIDEQINGWTLVRCEIIFPRAVGVINIDSAAYITLYAPGYCVPVPNSLVIEVCLALAALFFYSSVRCCVTSSYFALWLTLRCLTRCVVLPQYPTAQPHKSHSVPLLV